MFRTSVPLVVVAVLVISGLIIGAALNTHPTNAQASKASNMKALIQSYVDQKQAFTINNRASNFEVDGTKVKVSQLGDDFVCITGELSVMGRPFKTICDSLSSIIILVS